MGIKSSTGLRVVKAVHGRQEVAPDPVYVRGLAEELLQHYSGEGLLEIYGRFIHGYGALDELMRRVLWVALTRCCGDGLLVEPGAGFKHPETLEIGKGVFIGSQTFIQGRFDGCCKIGDHVWIGPQSYFDARDIVLEDYVGWGPGAKVLGSDHTGLPIDVPVLQTELEIRPVRIEAWADIGVNAVILPGVTVGRGSIVGAGSVVTRNVPPFAIVAGAPAKFLRWRDEYNPPSEI